MLIATTNHSKSMRVDGEFDGEGGERLRRKFKFWRHASFIFLALKSHTSVILISSVCLPLCSHKQKRGTRAAIRALLAACDKSSPSRGAEFANKLNFTSLHFLFNY